MLFRSKRENLFQKQNIEIINEKEEEIINDDLNITKELEKNEINETIKNIEEPKNNNVNLINNNELQNNSNIKLEEPVNNNSKNQEIVKQEDNNKKVNNIHKKKSTLSSEEIEKLKNERKRLLDEQAKAIHRDNKVDSNRERMNVSGQNIDEIIDRMLVFEKSGYTAVAQIDGIQITTDILKSKEEILLFLKAKKGSKTLNPTCLLLYWPSVRW